MNGNASTRVVIYGRLSYTHLFKPYSVVQGQDPKFSTTILIPKTDEQSKEKIDRAVKLAIKNGVEGVWGGVKPPIIPNPIWDGDGVKSDGTEFGQECKGHWVMTASAKAEYPPQVVDRKLQPILNQSEVYSGCYANVSVNFFPYAFAGKKGIGAGLGNVQKVKDGESLAGGKSAQEDFIAMSDEDSAW